MTTRVAYLTLQATTEGQAGHAHVHEIVDGLRKAGLDVELFAVRYRSQRPSLLQRVYGFISTQVQLLARLRSFDIVYVRWHFAAAPTAVACRIAHVPVVQEVNGPYQDLFLAYPWTRRLRLVFVFLGDLALRCANAVVAVTPELAKWVRDRVAAQLVRVIPNGANVRLFHPGATSSRQLPAPFVVFVGALAPWQGIDTLLDAVRSRGWPKEVNLVVVGDGHEREKVRTAAESMDNVAYLGRIPYRDVPGVVAASLASLTPKELQSGTGLAPLKVYEAFACGVPVIASRLPGLDVLLDNGMCGVLIEPGDAGQLAEAVALLHGDPARARAMGARGRANVEANHSWEARSRDTASLLHQVLNART